jgi:hypothetical protein
MWVDIGTYWARIGTFIVMSSVKKTVDTQEVMEGNLAGDGRKSGW